MVWSAICQLTPNMDPPKRLWIAHWKALGESYLLSHKSSSGGSMKELWPLEENKYKMVNMANPHLKWPLLLRSTEIKPWKVGLICSNTGLQVKQESLGSVCHQ